LPIKKSYELISCLFVAELNNELLLKNHKSHPTGTTRFPEMNTATYKNHGGGCGSRGRGHRRGRGQNTT